MNAEAQQTEQDLIAQDKADGERAANDSPDAMLPGIEYQIAKLDLKPGNILVVKITREGLTDKQLNQMQYGIQKFVGRKVLIVPPGSDLAVLEGTKVPK